MSAASEVALTAARTMLNDDGGNLWTDTALFPKLQQAHREMQAILRLASSPVMRNINFQTINSGVTSVTIPTDLIEPIKLWEKATTDPVTSYTLLTSSDPLPNLIAGPTLQYYQWQEELINLIGATANRAIQLLYWRSLPLPNVGTDLIGFIQGELYLAPRIAALAHASVGEKENATYWDSQAASKISIVVLANKGKLKPLEGVVIRP